MSYLGNEPQFTQYPSKFFNGDGSAMTVSLDYAPPNAAALLVFIDGVRQDTSAYTLSGTSMTFTGTVPSGTNNVQVVHMGLTQDVGVPADDTISTAKIQDDAVTSAKILDGTIVNADINASAAIDATKIADGSVTSTEFQYINTLSSNAQTQIDTKAAVGTANTWTAGQRGEITALTSAATITIDMADSNNFSCTLAHNAAFANPSNLTAGQSGSIFLTQDGSGSRTASWGTNWDFAGGTAPTLTTTASAVDRIDYVVLDSSNIHAVATLNLS
jgi:hypothetical protein